jgi:chloramphenicol O-acetyltransferase type A
MVVVVGGAGDGAQAYNGRVASLAMSRYLDLSTWPRRDAFEFFRHFDKPFFNVCVRLDVAPLKAALADRPGIGLSLACYYLALRLVNRHAPFRWRIEQDRVREHDEVHGSTTVLRDDGESFFFADLVHRADFAAFCAQATAAIDAARTRRAEFAPKPEESAVVYFTTLPWLHFTSFSHARQWARDGARDDSIPRFAFGRAERDGARLWLPLSVEVNHALMDGVHVGRFVQDFEAMVAEPRAWLGVRA